LKKLILFFFCILFIHYLALAEYANFPEIFSPFSSDLFKPSPKEKQMASRNDLRLNPFTLSQYSDNEIESSSARKAGVFFLSQYSDNEIESSSARKAGVFFVYAGLGVVSAGIAYLAGAESSVFNKESYRKTGLILLGVGGGLILVGIILRKVSADKRSFIELNLNPFQGRLEIRYQINFLN